MEFKGICLLNAYQIMPGAAHFYERMEQELSVLGIVLEKKTNAEILSYLDSDGHLKKNKLNADFVLFLDKDLYISYQLEGLGYRLFNSARAIELCDDKMKTYLALAEQGIAMPKTITGPLNYSGKQAPAFVENVEKLLSFPLVAKENYGSLGQNVYLLENHEALTRFEKEHGSVPRLYQEFIASSKGKDYRLIIIGGKFAAGMLRENTNGDFRSNIALGGTGKAVTIPESFIALAEKAAQILALDYCGVDVLIGEEGEPILCEVNSNAFIGGIEPVTGINVAKIYAEHIQKEILRSRKNLLKR
jgi:gamma-F420-2:alpha-L-glutamate ligase